VRLSCLVLVLGSVGCVGDLVDLKASSVMAGDLGHGASDGSAPGDSAPPPDGGAVGFDAILGDVVALGCAAASCHGSTQTPVLRDAPDAAVRLATFQAFVGAASSGANSTVLTKNLAGDNITHVGGKPFASTSDGVYQRWLAWIAAGNPP